MTNEPKNDAGAWAAGRGAVPASTNADSLSLDHMRSFLAVVDHGTQGGAAAALRVSPGTISRHVERVQEHFGGGLFRAGSSGELSTRGELVATSLRVSLAELQRTRERVGEDGPVLRMGFIRVIRPLVERALRLQLRQQTARFDVRLLELASQEQVRALVARELDVALCYARSELATRTGIVQETIVEHPYVLVAPKDVVSKGRLNTKALLRLRHARVPHADPGVDDAIGAWLVDQGLSQVRPIDCARGTEVLAYAGAGMGFGFLPAIWNSAQNAHVVFVRVSLPVSVHIVAYSLAHVAPRIAPLRERLSALATEGLQELPCL